MAVCYGGIPFAEMLFLPPIRKGIFCLLVTLPFLGLERPSLAAHPVRSGTPVRDTIPRPVGYVNDFEHLFTPEQIDTLDNLLHDYEQRTSIEIAILTVDSSLTVSGNFDFFTLKTMSAWGVGKKEKNNGILIGISRSFHKIRIQNGGGIERVLSNADTKKIIDDDFIPFFKKGQYYEGVLSGLKTLMQRLE